MFKLHSINMTLKFFFSMFSSLSIFSTIYRVCCPQCAYYTHLLILLSLRMVKKLSSIWMFIAWSSTTSIRGLLGFFTFYFGDAVVCWAFWTLLMSTSCWPTPASYFPFMSWINPSKLLSDMDCLRNPFPKLSLAKSSNYYWSISFWSCLFSSWDASGSSSDSCNVARASWQLTI